MNEISTSIMRATKDTTTGNNLIWPQYESLIIPDTPNYRNGTRSDVSSYGTHNLQNFAGTPEALISDISADFQAIKQPSYRLNSAGEYEVVPNHSFLINSKTDNIIAKGITDKYSIFQFDTAIYYLLAMIEMIKKMGLEVTPAYGQVWENGAKLFLQYKVDGTTLMGEKVDTYLTLLSSHDKSSSLVIALTAVRCFCRNCVTRALKNATHKLSLRHTAGNQNKLEYEANKLIETRKKNLEALEDYERSLYKIKISEKDIYDNYAAIKQLDTMTTQRQIDNFKNQATQLIACYRQPDIANFKNTALAGYFAYSDFDQHIIPNRKTADSTYIESSLDGFKLGNFTDSLVSRVSM